MSLTQTAIKKIKSLPEEQIKKVLSYIESIEKVSPFTKPSNSELEVMANDPDIQRELKQIDEEFSHTNLDGLGNY